MQDKYNKIKIPHPDTLTQQILENICIKKDSKELKSFKILLKTVIKEMLEDENEKIFEEIIKANIQKIDIKMILTDIINNLNKLSKEVENITTDLNKNINQETINIEIYNDSFDRFLKNDINPEPLDPTSFANLLIEEEIKLSDKDINFLTTRGFSKNEAINWAIRYKTKQRISEIMNKSKIKIDKLKADLTKIVSNILNKYNQINSNKEISDYSIKKEIKNNLKDISIKIDSLI